MSPRWTSEKLCADAACGAAKGEGSPAIKAPALLEVTGPLWMSFAVASNVQYRLKEENGGTLITLKHSAFGRFPDGFGAPARQGWKNIFTRVRQRAEAAR